MEKQLEAIRNQLITLLLTDFRKIVITKAIEDWPRLSWFEFTGELFLQEINLELCNSRDWESVFFTEKERYITIQREIFKLQNLQDIRQYLNLN